MTSITDQLSKKVVLNNSQVVKIREQISASYYNETPKQKANRLANSIHAILDRSLPNFNEEIKNNIRIALIKQTVASNSLTITNLDIVNSSVEIGALDIFGDELIIWMTKEVQIDIHMLEEYIYNFQKVSKEEVAVTSIDLIPNVKVVLPSNDKPSLIKQKRTLFVSLAVLVVSFLTVVALQNNKVTDKAVDVVLVENKHIVATEVEVIREPNELPSNLQYATINDHKLREWLNGRNSLLADEPYFSTILQVSDEFNIHPLLLFAITGQEQGFVSRNHKNAVQIANNPFNVFHSWEKFNTNILESTQIASRTIVNLSKDRPEKADPIQWINRKYAEDPNWWVGVASIFRQLEQVVKN